MLKIESEDQSYRNDENIWTLAFFIMIMKVFFLFVVSKHAKAIIMDTAYMKNIISFFDKNYWLILVIVFLVIYAFSITFVYLEGDDATIIAYQLFGRDNSIQPRYASYQGMFDVLLSTLPTNEPVLRVFSISISALSACIFTILAVKIAYSWTAVKIKGTITIVLLLLLFSPELFFSGLYINPTMLSLVLVLCAHFLIKQVFHKKFFRVIVFILSALLFGFGISFRWSTVIYSVVIFFDMAMDDLFLSTKEYSRISIRNVFTSCLWFFIAICSALFFITLSLGDEIINFEFSTLFLLVKTYLLSDNSPIFSMISLAKLLTLFSPLLLFFSAIGILTLLRKKAWKFIIIFFVQILLIATYLKTGNFKESLVIIPITWFLFIEGFNRSAEVLKPKFLIPIALTLAILPWFIGVKIHSTSTLWGPGFELRKPDESSLVDNSVLLRYSAEYSYSLGSINFVFAGGFALETPEGPRPLGGYYYVLPGGTWREFLKQQDKIVKEITHMGINEHIILHVGGGKAIKNIIELVNSGYFETQIEDNPQSVVGALPHREFLDLQGNRVTIAYLYDGDELSNKVFCDTNPQLCQRQIPVNTNYSSVLNRLYGQFPQANLKVLSPFTGVLLLQ